MNHESSQHHNISRKTKPLDLDDFSRYLKTLDSRLTELYLEASDKESFTLSSLMPKTFKELGILSEELQVAFDELLEQKSELIGIRQALNIECQRYKNLFNLAPDAYIVTDHTGVIREANRAAGYLFNSPEEYLINQLFINFVVPEDHGKFNTQLSLLQKYRFIKDFDVQMQPRYGEMFQASLRVSCLDKIGNEPIELRFCIRNKVVKERVSSLKTNNHHFPININSQSIASKYSSYFYDKGEVIPLDPQTIWLVSEGVVKLSTFSDTGEEVILGLATSQTPFGSSLTSLEIYEVTAMSERVELINIPLTEIARTDSVFSFHLNQRIRQAEAFLSIYGQRRVKDRLVHLLKLLKQYIGEPTPQGIRLQIRLTHQELADACCTTRVTITRLLNQLQKEQKVRLDPQNHLVICEDNF